MYVLCMYIIVAWLSTSFSMIKLFKSCHMSFHGLPTGPFSAHPNSKLPVGPWPVQHLLNGQTTGSTASSSVCLQVQQHTHLRGWEVLAWLWPSVVLWIVPAETWQFWTISRASHTQEAYFNVPTAGTIDIVPVLMHTLQTWDFKLRNMRIEGNVYTVAQSTLVLSYSFQRLGVFPPLQVRIMDIKMTNSPPINNRTAERSSATWGIPRQSTWTNKPTAEQTHPWLSGWAVTNHTARVCGTDSYHGVTAWIAPDLSCWSSRWSDAFFSPLRSMHNGKQWVLRPGIHHWTT